MPTKTRQTKISTAKLSDLARHVVRPSGIVKSGWPKVERKLGDLAISFDGWQVGSSRLILGKRADGKFAATVGGVVMSIPRQVGKTFLLGALIFALCLLNKRTTVLWTAHRLRTAEETFAKMQGFARRRKIAPLVDKVILGSGEGAIVFANGSRILFGARERGFGRGFDEVDIIVFDEAQILTENALDDMIPAANQATMPGGALVFYIGTPPKPSDPGEVFAQKRRDALSGESEDTVYVEFSADKGARPDDWAQIAKANPSYPHRTPRESILRMRKNLRPDSFLREGLGIWDDDESAGPFDGNWAGGVDADSRIAAGVPRGVSVDVAWDRSVSHVSVAGERDDGKVHVEVMASGPGTAWVTSWLADRVGGKWSDWDLKGIAVQKTGAPVSSLVPEMLAAGLPVVEMSGPELGQAWGRIYDLAKQDELRHRPAPVLDVPAAKAVTRKVGAGALIDRIKSLEVDVDASPVLTAAGAVWLVSPQPDEVLELEGSLMV